MGLNNLFLIEQQLIERVRDNMPSLKTVASASVVSSKTDIKTLCDGVFLIPGAGDAQSQSGSVALDQQWTVIVAVRSNFDPADIDTTAIQGGDLCAQVIQLLHDWSPTGEYFNMQFAGHGNAYFGAGYGEFPLYFNVKSVFRGLSQ
ncbi:MAG: hypothetical protein AB2747_05410 [Candidatus Thiodiazotropha taylori]